MCCGRGKSGRSGRKRKSRGRLTKEQRNEASLKRLIAYRERKKNADKK
jgi:hypothetical protein